MPGEEVKVHIDGDERQDMSLHLAWQLASNWQ